MFCFQLSLGVCLLTLVALRSASLRCLFGQDVCLAKAPSSQAFAHRQTVIIDDASHMHDLNAILMMRLLPHTERLILVGDDKQLAPCIAQQEATSVLDLATAIIPSASSRPHASNHSFFASRQMFDTSYRMPRRLCGMISQLFYDCKLKSHKVDDSRRVEWKHVAGSANPSGSSSDLDELSKLHTLFMLRGYTNDEIVVLCLDNAQRKRVSDALPLFTVCNVDSFQGQEVNTTASDAGWTAANRSSELHSSLRTHT